MAGRETKNRRSRRTGLKEKWETEEVMEKNEKEGREKEQKEK